MTPAELDLYLHGPRVHVYCRADGTRHCSTDDYSRFGVEPEWRGRCPFVTLMSAKAAA